MQFENDYERDSKLKKYSQNSQYDYVNNKWIFKMLRIKFYDWIGVQWNAAYLKNCSPQIKIQSSKRRNSIVFVSNNFTGISIALCWNFVLFFYEKHCFLLIIGVLIPNRYSTTLRIRWLWCFRWEWGVQHCRRELAHV